MAIEIDLGGLRALVCGASGGIGRATALALASAGAAVAALARSGEKLAGLTPDLLGAGAPEAHALPADMDETDALAAAVATDLEAHGPVHVLVNNTGGPPPGRLLDAEEEHLLAAYRRHLLAAQALTGLLLPGMEAAGYGRIVNVVSTSVREPIPGLGVSNVTRAAMAGWAKTLADELPPGITVNNVLPGYTDTERLRSLGDSIAARTGRTAAEVREDWIAKVPEGRLGLPREPAALVAFLASPLAGYVRGQSIAVDGGRLRSI